MPDRLVRLLDGDDDERQDNGTRRRVQEIAAGLKAWSLEVDRRQRRVALWTMAVAVFTLVSVALGYALLQGQRYEATRDACHRTNQQSAATVGLLRDLDVRPQVILVAQVRYPHVPPVAHRDGRVIRLGPPPGYKGPMTCGEYATERVGPFRL